MESERTRAKAAASDPEQNDPELLDQLADAGRYKVDLLREQNRSREAMAKIDAGWFGGIFGVGRNAQNVIAFLAFLICLAVAVGCFAAAYRNAERADFWSQQAAVMTGLAGTALGFALGGLKS